MTIKALQERILAEALPQVAFEGWSARALRIAAADAGLPPEAVVRAFPGGVDDAIRCWAEAGDQAMASAMAAEAVQGLKMREKIAAAVRARIEADGRHKEAVRRALSFLALPWNAALGARLSYRTVDAIWHACGDRSADFNWYTKRATLAAVYAATVLYWLDDDSEDSAQTWEFLRRRIDDLLKLPRLGQSWRRWFSPEGGRYAAFRAARH
jgi:ubiquinone biosynthesis protein COQ9